MCSEYKAAENKLYVVMEAGSEDLATFFRRETQGRKMLSDSVTWFYWERMLLAVQALHREGGDSWSCSIIWIELIIRTCLKFG